MCFKDFPFWIDLSKASLPCIALGGGLEGAACGPPRAGGGGGGGGGGGRGAIFVCFISAI